MIAQNVDRCRRTVHFGFRIFQPPEEPQRHREHTEENTEQDISNTKTQRHEDRPPAQRKKPQITQMNADGPLDAAVPRLAAEQSAIWRSPPTGEQHGISGRKRPSLPCCPPDDAPGARRFRLASLRFLRRGGVHPPTGNEEWRGCALRERRPLGRDTATIAGDRSGFPSQRFLAVVRRPRPRHVLNSRGLSVSTCVICGCSVRGWVTFAFFASLR